MRLTLVISSLSRGGVEHVMSTLAGYWAAAGHEVTLLSLGPTGSDAYPLPPAVRRIGLNLLHTPRHLLRAILDNIERWRKLRSTLLALRPDAIVSFAAETNILTLAACAGFDIPVVVSERVDPRAYRIGWCREWLRRRLYPRARAVTVQTEAVRRWMAREIPGARARVIPNPAVFPDDAPPGPPGASSPDPALPSGGRWIVAMGRLTPQKGFDLLLRAFARCAPDHPEWRLAILGEGRERAPLEALGTELGIRSRLWLPGLVSRPAEILRRADLFVLPSRFEGFPNALLEAMACGLAAIAADCPSGPGDIIREGENGLLVPPEDPDSLSSAMRLLMGNETARRRLASAAPGVTRQFSFDRVMGLWDALLSETRPACFHGAPTP